MKISLRVAGNLAQCVILFPSERLRINWWGGPPGPRGTPSSRRFVKNQSAANTKEPTRGSAAYEGVHPTICAIAPKRERYVALGNLACRRAFQPAGFPPARRAEVSTQRSGAAR
jgi:hypothetical protein